MRAAGFARSFSAPHHEMHMARPLWAEQDPDDWWGASQSAIRGVLREAGVDGDAIAGIGLTGQMHGLVLLDAEGKVIRPALIWCDQRSQRQVDFVNHKLGVDAVLQSTANPMLTGFTLPKLLWVRDNEPEQFASDSQGTAAERLHPLQADRGIRHRCFGRQRHRHVRRGEPALGAQMMTGLDLDRQHSAAGDGIQRDQRRSRRKGPHDRRGFPPARLWLAARATRPRAQSGTASWRPAPSPVRSAPPGWYLPIWRSPRTIPQGRVHTFCHAIPNAWHVMGVTQGAGLSLQWFRNRFAPGIEYDDLTAEATLSPAGADGLFWLPYLMGERTPHLDAERARRLGRTDGQTSDAPI